MGRSCDPASHVGRPACPSLTPPCPASLQGTWGQGQSGGRSQTRKDLDRQTVQRGRPRRPPQPGLDGTGQGQRGAVFPANTGPLLIARSPRQRVTDAQWAVLRPGPRLWCRAPRRHLPQCARVVPGDGRDWDGTPGGNRDPCLQDVDSRGRHGKVCSCREPSFRPGRGLRPARLDRGPRVPPAHGQSGPPGSRQLQTPAPHRPADPRRSRQSRKHEELISPGSLCVP